MPRKSSSPSPDDSQLGLALFNGDEPEDLHEKSFFTVSELTDYLRHVISADPILGQTVIVTGELSNLSPSSRGHVYFNLRDDSALIKGVIWASLAKKLKFDPEDGMEVLITGKIDLYAPSGTYSLVVQKLEPVGMGALQMAFEQLKARLDAEGLFDEDFKKPIPRLPRKIGIITSATGAVIHDMIRVLRRKNPTVDVLLAPVKVQGDGAAEEIAAAIKELNRPEYQIDTLIVGRGGGSMEDLFCFSEEVVVRAIFKSHIPVIAGIGHEPDYGLADAVADFSASTPTAAAEYAVSDIEQLRSGLQMVGKRLAESLAYTLRLADQQFDQLVDSLIRSLRGRLTDSEQRLANRKQELRHRMQTRMQSADHQLTQAAGILHSVSPLATLSRGYSIALNAKNQVVKHLTDAPVSSPLKIQVTDGQLHCEVKHHEPTTL